MNNYVETYESMYSIFYGPFWEKSIEDQVKLLGSNVLSCCLKITMANLRKIGPKMRE